VTPTAVTPTDLHFLQLRSAMMASMLPLLLAVVSFSLDFVASSSPASNDSDACVAFDAAQCAVHTPNCTWSSEEKCHKALEAHRDRIERLGNRSRANQENRSRNHPGCADMNETTCVQTEGKCIWSAERNICHTKHQNLGKPGGRKGKGSGKVGRKLNGTGSGKGRTGEGQANAMPRQDAGKPGKMMAGPSNMGEESGKGRTGEGQAKAMPRVGIFVIGGSAVAVLICMCLTCLICSKRRKQAQGVSEAQPTPATSIADGMVVDKFGAPAFVEGVAVDGALSKV